uniref:Piwi-like protein 2 n=1 Tax=Cacopsylla melanoneura TaxID=428564 RepID=A0A8D8XUH9_9HEMI
MELLREEKQIFIYRDGVSDGQLESVSRVELDQYQQIVDSLMKTIPSCEYAPKITATIVQKRINTKIFQVLSPGACPNLENPPPGTTLDHTVTRKTLKEKTLKKVAPRRVKMSTKLTW